MSTLYEHDDTAWAEEQIGKLRALAELRPNVDLDIEHLIAELEIMARSDRKEALSFARLSIQRLLLLRYSNADEPRLHWRDEVREFRVRLEDALNPTVRRHGEEQLDTAYAKAHRLVAEKLVDLGEAEAAAALPAQRPPEMTLAHLLDPDWRLP